MSSRPFSQACERNKAPIAQVLAGYLQSHMRVLEVGSGTGQHAVHFAARWPAVQWLTSDLAANHDGIRAWLEHAPHANVAPPLDLDTRAVHWPLDQPVDVIFSANTAHIMPWEAVCGLFRGAGEWLIDDGWLLLYGPFRFPDKPFADSNRQFDQSLRLSDPQMGIRDVSALDQQAAVAGLTRMHDHPMPANNYILAWQRRC